MKIMTITDLRKQLANVVDAVIQTEEPVAIPRTGGEAVVIVPMKEWESMRETLYLLGTRANARALLDSMDEVDRGDTMEAEMVDGAIKWRDGNSQAA